MKFLSRIIIQVFNVPNVLLYIKNKISHNLLFIKNIQLQSILKSFSYYKVC